MLLHMQWFRSGLVFEALVSLSLRLKDLLGTVKRVKKKHGRGLVSAPRSPRMPTTLRRGIKEVD